MPILSLILTIFLFFNGSLSFAKVYGPSAQEVEFSYRTTFLSKDFKQSAEGQALYHSAHLFGYFSMPEVVQSYGLDHEIVGGIGAPRWPVRIHITSDEVRGQSKRDRVREITYSVQGKLLLHKKAAQKILRQGGVEIILPAQTFDYYNKKCTDPEYFDITDYWYFYNIYREGCEYLQEEPYGKVVELRVRSSVQMSAQSDPRLDLVRGDNGNGRLFDIYLVHGFDEGPQKKRDVSRLNFNELRKYFQNLGFYETVVHDQKTREHYIYEKWQTSADGERFQTRVHHLLADTELNSRGLTFAKFFKDAVENADVFIYMGHSGLGSVLDIEGIKARVGDFDFNHDKRQIFYFDACSSYSFFLSSFLDQKTTAKIDVLTYGLSSYFHTTYDVNTRFLDHLLAEDPVTSWDRILRSMEDVLGGGSYLLNVGGL